MERFAGIDVAKDSLEVFIRPDTNKKSFANNEKASMLEAFKSAFSK
jgi:hypothetical protein